MLGRRQAGVNGEPVRTGQVRRLLPERQHYGADVHNPPPRDSQRPQGQQATSLFEFDGPKGQRFEVFDVRFAPARNAIVFGAAQRRVVRRGDLASRRRPLKLSSMVDPTSAAGQV